MLLRQPASSLGHQTLLPRTDSSPAKSRVQPLRRSSPVRVSHSPERLWSEVLSPRRRRRRSESRIARAVQYWTPSLCVQKVSRSFPGPTGESQSALRTPASSLSLGWPRAPAPRREGGGNLNKVPSPGPGGRRRSLVTRCPRHTPAASAEGRARSARGWGWVGGEARRPDCGSPTLSSPALCQLNPQRGGGMGPFQTLSLESYSRNPFLR